MVTTATAAMPVKQILGFSREEVIGKHYTEFLTAKDQETQQTYATSQQPFYSLVNHYQHKNGNEVLAESTGLPIINAEGKLLKWRGVDRDITARMHFQSELIESEKRTRLIIESSMNAIVIMDSYGIITDWNPRAEKMFGWSRNEAIGQRLDELIIPTRFRNAHRKGLHTFLQTGVAPILNKQTEQVALRHDGTEFPVELSVSPLKLGNSYIFSGFIHDISGRKAAEEEIRQAQVNLAISQNELQIAQQIQASLSPSLPLVSDQFEVTGACLPANKVGGDYYDYFMRHPSQLDIVIADVSGHSIGPALFMVETRSAIRAQTNLSASPAETLGVVNSFLFDDLDHSDYFITLFYLQVDLEQQRIRFANAGHPPPLLLNQFQKETGAAIAVSFVYVVVQIYGVGLITSHLTGFGFELGVFVGLGGVLVCSFLGGMRAVTWTQVAQYLVLMVAFLLPLTWLSLNQTGSWLPMLSYGTQLERVSELERELAADPAEQEVMALMAFRAAAAERKLRDVRTAMLEDEQLQLQRIAALRAENAPLARIQRAEREFAQRPRTEAQARRLYQRERDSALARAERLAGMPPQTLPFASFGSAHVGDAAADTAAGDTEGRRFDAARINFIALVLCLMMGTAAMPHVLTRYYTTPSVSQARRSVAWSLFFITLLYVAAPALAVLVKFEVLQHVVGLPIDDLPAWVSRWSRLDPGLVSVRDVNGDGILQLGELMMAGDIIVLAAPEIGGLPYWVTCLVAVGGMAAALSTADGLLLTVANASLPRRLLPRHQARRVGGGACHRLQGAGHGDRLRRGADRGAEDHRHPAIRVGGLLACRGGLLPGAGAGHLLAPRQPRRRHRRHARRAGRVRLVHGDQPAAAARLAGHHAAAGRDASGGAWSRSRPASSACRWALPSWSWSAC